MRALLIAWALHEDTTTLLRTLLSASTPPERTVLSSWLLSGLGLDTLRQQVQGSWSEARPWRAYPVYAAFSVAVHGAGCIRKPRAPGWHNEPVHTPTGSVK